MSHTTETSYFLSGAVRQVKQNTAKHRKLSSKLDNSSILIMEKEIILSAFLSEKRKKKQLSHQDSRRETFKTIEQENFAYGGDLAVYELLSKCSIK